MNTTLLKPRIEEKVEKKVPLFRSEIERKLSVTKSVRTLSLSGLSPDGVKVSEHKLEQYLNACSPTCHG